MRAVGAGARREGDAAGGAVGANNVHHVASAAALQMAAGAAAHHGHGVRVHHGQHVVVLGVLGAHIHAHTHAPHRHRRHRASCPCAVHAIG